MKNILILMMLFSSNMLLAQQIDYNEQDGAIAGGYDVVAYFDGKAKKGKAAHMLKSENATFLFMSAKNMQTFQENPEKYKPQYGGWCAYAMANKQKVEVEPESYEIRNGKLYLFYKSYFNSALKKWKSEGPTDLAKKATIYWETVKYKK